MKNFQKLFFSLLIFIGFLSTSFAIDINSASESELLAIKGLGKVKVDTIIKEREKEKFKNWNDFISRVKGIGEKSASNLSENGLKINGLSVDETNKKPKKITQTNKEKTNQQEAIKEKKN